MDADVVIIGAGFAGIAAARDLLEAGRTVVVLEARNRIGGRTWYKEMPGAGVSAEYGGMFFSRETQPNLAREIERYAIAVTPAITDPAEMAWVRGSERLAGSTAYDEVRGKLGASNLMTALDETAEAFRSGGRTELARLDVTSATWVDGIDASEDAADYLRAFLAAMGGGKVERTSVLPLLWDMVELEYNPVDAYLDLGELFANGTKSLIDAMADGVDVRFGTVVASVVHDADGVRVMSVDGEAWIGSAAVVALPINCWADLVFDPPLAPNKRRVAAEGHVGEVSKVLAVVRNAPETFLGMGWDTPVNAGFVTKQAQDGRLFMGFSVQDRVDLADPGAVASAVSAHLPEAEIVATDGHDWVSDPFSKGAWLAIPPGWFSDGTFEQLEVSEGRLAFAGSDIASEGAGWIEGAIGSGRQAAARVGPMLQPRTDTLEAVAMASVFTRIIRGEEPAWIVWRDEHCVAFLAATPVRPGHVLVVPIEEVDDWLDLDDGDAAHLLRVARTLGLAIKTAFAPKRVGLMIAGFDVAHVHLHVVPLEAPRDLDYDSQRMDVTEAELDEARSRILASLSAS